MLNAHFKNCTHSHRFIEHEGFPFPLVLLHTCLILLYIFFFLALYIISLKCLHMLAGSRVLITISITAVHSIIYLECQWQIVFGDYNTCVMVLQEVLCQLSLNWSLHHIMLPCHHPPWHIPPPRMITCTKQETPPLCKLVTTFCFQNES